VSNACRKMPVMFSQEKEGAPVDTRQKTGAFDRDRGNSVI